MILRFYHFFFALLALSALVYDLSQSSNIIHYFSYFTILSNYLGVFLFFNLGIRGNKRGSFIDSLRGAILVYIVVSGIVYAILLEHLPDSHPIPWVNLVFHKTMPAAVILDWFIYPIKNRLSFKNSFIWLIFPLVYLGYSFVQGLITHWYPYSFLNPNKIGYQGVFMYCLVMLLTGWLGALGVIYIGNKWLTNRLTRSF